MDDKKKLRVRFNLFDALILLLALGALAGALLLRNRSTGTGAERDTVPMRFTVEFLQAPPGMAKAVTVGDEVFRSTDSTYLGRVVEVRAQTHTEIEYSPAQSAFVAYECAESEDVYLTIENRGYSTARDIMIGSVAVKYGEEMPVKGKGYAKMGYVVGIDTMGAAVTENTAECRGELSVVYRVSLADARAFFAENVHVGDRFYDKLSGTLLGTVRTVGTEPYGETHLADDGTAQFALKPGRWRVIVELEGRCVEKNDGYYLDGGTELKIGATLEAESQYIARMIQYGEIVSIGTAA